MRYMRALYYGSGLKGTAPAGERAGLIQKSNELLEQLTADPGYARKALATLAAQQFYERDYDTAVTTYGRFVRAYPESEWAWIAAMRIGQAQITKLDGTKIY